MTLRKQKDPKMQQAGRKAAETRRTNLERLREKDRNTDRKERDAKTAETESTLPKDLETKWHITSQSTLTLKVDLPPRERLSDFCDTPWVEKYRPISLNDCIGDVAGYFKAFVKTGSFPLACILHGEYGDGKTTIAKAAVRDYFVLRGLFHREATFKDITNASKVTREYNGIFAPALFIDTTIMKATNGYSGVEVIRTRVQNFMQYSVGKWPKFIVIDEADRLGHDCQEILTSLIEKYPRTRTIWTLNDIDNIMDRIVSRAAGGVFELKKPEPKLIIPRLRHVAKWEHVRMPDERLKEIANNAPSVRDAIGLLQQQCVLVKATSRRRK
jgi:DNA polymerase III gamma/tau subunit